MGTHGFDTVAFAWHDPLTVARFRELASHSGHRTIWDGRFLRLSDRIAGLLVGCYPNSGLIWAEARLAAMLAGGDTEDRLAPARSLPRGAQLARLAVQSVGIDPTGPTQVRRLDPAAELLFERRIEGLTFLRASADGLHLARWKSGRTCASGGGPVETVEWRAAGRVQLRLYDAGVRHKTHERGERLRLERQVRWRADGVQTPEQVATGDLAALFAGRPLLDWLITAESIVVVPPLPASVEIFEAVRRREVGRGGDRLTRRKAESLVGKIAALHVAGDLLDDRARRDRVRELLDYGIALNLSNGTTAEGYDLSRPLRALVSTWGSA